ncbi:MAG: MTH1187 family thiamine-binding protein [Methanomassiliicoccales archaeon]|nr:MTH1187 family thiamine-binding protein [Methanomassiliicoccales archaeon]
MIAEFSVVPIGKGESLSPYVAECLKIVKASGLRYQFTSMGTILEGDFDEVMEVIADCHKMVKGMSNRVSTSINIDDRTGGEDEIRRKTMSVEKRLAQ